MTAFLAKFNQRKRKLRTPSILIFNNLLVGSKKEAAKYQTTWWCTSLSSIDSHDCNPSHRGDFRCSYLLAAPDSKHSTNMELGCLNEGCIMHYHQNLEPMKTQVPKKNLGFQEKPRFLLFMVFTSFNKFDEFHELEWIRSLWSSNFLDTHQIRPLTNPSGSLMFFSFSPLIIPWWIQIHASSYEQPSVSAAKF